MLALVDGNNFFANAEISLRPSLKGVPLVVLSSNDACAIARSDEARALGIKMGQPWHEIRHFEHSAGLIGVSANFGLYTDISDRVMSIAAGLGHRQLIYSVDEAFADLSGIRGDLKKRAFAVRERILKWTGIPCCVGLGPTMTLAKFANHVAKDAERKPGSYPAEHARVCDLSSLSREHLEQLLNATPVGDVWGIGRCIGAQLTESGITTALDLARMNPTLARTRWSVVLERTVRELQGIQCIAFDDAPGPKKQIARTRSFGQPIHALEPLIQAVSHFASLAAFKLRAQASCTGQVLVFLRTSPFREGPQFSRSVCIPMPGGCADTANIVSAAVGGLRAIYRPGFAFTKAGVMLLDLQTDKAEQLDLDVGCDEVPRNRQRLMLALDAVNDRWGKGTLSVGSGVIGRQHQLWMSKKERVTPGYTTDWNALPIARA